MTLASFSKSLRCKDSKNEPCKNLCAHFLTNGWILSKLAQILHQDGVKKYFDFGGLDLIFKVIMS